MVLYQQQALLAMAALGLSLCALLLIQRRRRRRRYKVKPVNRTRQVIGNCLNYEIMRTWDYRTFFKATRMTLPVFQKLLQRIQPGISRQHRSDGISAEQRLVITLQYLSQGTPLQALADKFHVGLTTVHKIVDEVCSEIWEVLSPEYFKPPSQEDWLDIVEGYFEHFALPCCVGAIDAKQVQFKFPNKRASTSSNRKNLNMAILAHCDIYYKFTMLSLGMYGSLQTDSAVRFSTLSSKPLEVKGLEQTPPSYKTNREVPFFFAANEALPVNQLIVRPYPGTDLPEKQDDLNFRLSEVRNILENAFGMLGARWRILKTTITAEPSKVEKIIRAVMVLHNYCITELEGDNGNLYCPYEFFDSDFDEDGLWRKEQSPLQSVDKLSDNSVSQTMIDARDTLADYISSFKID